ncbi:MAG: hypothetical protein KGI60_03190, partial [Patescibacteria group bacterium]|nr:hypothetical protein [Patescibacteria group bacterium]
MIKALHLHRQFAISFRIGSRAKRVHAKHGNRRIAAGILAGEFGKPWNFLAEIPLHQRGFAAPKASNQ